MTWQSFRERANVWLYDSKERVLGTFQWLTLLVNLSALSVLAIYYGYEHDAETSASLFDVVKFSFGFYVLHYLVRVLYHFHPTTFFKETWAEGVVMAVLLVEGVGDLLWGSPPLGQGLAVLVPSIGDFSTFLVQGYLFVAVLMEWMRPGSRLPSCAPSPCGHLHFELCVADCRRHMAAQHAPDVHRGRRHAARGCLFHRDECHVRDGIDERGHHDLLHFQRTLGASVSHPVGRPELHCLWELLGARVQIWGGCETARRDRRFRQQRQPSGEQWHLGKGGRVVLGAGGAGRGGPHGLVVPGSRLQRLG